MSDNTTLASVGVDFGALLATVGAFEHIVPTAVAVLAGVWYSLEIYNSPPVRRWRELRRSRKAAVETVKTATHEATILVETSTAEAEATQIKNVAAQTVAALAEPKPNEAPDVHYE